MADKVVNMLTYLIENKDGYAETLEAVRSAMSRPYLLRGKENHTEEEIAAWFIESLWVEGYKIVRAEDD